jgi:phosphoglycolate phosphatase-like HAD superfamily hydrolase
MVRGAGEVTKHIVWDWNGTLFDDAHAVYRAACAVFAARGLPSVSFEHYRAAYTRPIQDFYARLFGREMAAEEFAGMDDEFHAAYARAMADAALAAGARDALRAWRAGGGSQSLLSMFRHEPLLELVRRFDIEAEFARVDGLVGPGGGRKARHLTAHLAALRTDPADVLLVGDSLDDAAAAAELGAGCLLFNGGYHERSALMGAGVPVADTMAEVIDRALRWVR